MFTPTRNLMLLALLTAPLHAQEPAEPKKPAKPAAGSLEAAIEDALQHNSDIQAAAARVREAQILHNKTRNEVIVRITAQYQILAAAREVLKTVEESLAMKQQRAGQGAISISELLDARTEFNRARTVLVEAEATLMKLIGRVPGQPPAAGFLNEVPILGPVNRGSSFWIEGANLHVRVRAAAPPPNPVTDRLREMLMRPVKLESPIKGNVTSILTELSNRGLKELPLRTIAAPVFNETIDLMPGEFPLSAWLQAVQDLVPELRFVVREYGLLATTTDRLPPDGLLLSEFLRPPPPESK